MRLLPRFTVVESLVMIGIVLILGALLLPGSATTTRWRLEKRARDYAPTSASKLADESIIVSDADLAGTWTCQHRLNGSTLSFSLRSDGRFDTDFSTGGCLGGCELRRIASLDTGVIRLDSAVAEYLPRTYNTLYVIRIDGTDYLLPAESLADFEHKLKSGSAGWESYVFRRGSDANELGRVDHF